MKNVKLYPKALNSACRVGRSRSEKSEDTGGSLQPLSKVELFMKVEKKGNDIFRCSMKYF